MLAEDGVPDRVVAVTGHLGRIRIGIRCFAAADQVFRLVLPHGPVHAVREGTHVFASVKESVVVEAYPLIVAGSSWRGDFGP